MAGTATAASVGVSVSTSVAVTPRGVIDPLRLCHLRCSFCYYLHGDMESVQSWEACKDQVDAAASRGDTCLDITGGEPLRHPQIADIVRYALERYGMRSRIISSLIAPPRVIDQVMDAGLDDWLISMHGCHAQTHDVIVKIPRARLIQTDRLRQILQRMRICVNYVAVANNQDEIADFSAYVLLFRPRIVNFINFNPHYEWRTRPESADLVVDLRIAGPQLDVAIDTLEAAGVGVNVRYFPMCALAERHRKNVCNDLHVAFDSGEWSNALPTKDAGEAYNYGVRLSLANEEKGGPCSSCGHQWVCGGANRHWHAASVARYGEQLVPIALPSGVHPRDFMAYRRHNGLGMA